MINGSALNWISPLVHQDQDDLLGLGVQDLGLLYHLAPFNRSLLIEDAMDWELNALAWKVDTKPQQHGSYCRIYLEEESWGGSKPHSKDQRHALD